MLPILLFAISIFAFPGFAAANPEPGSQNSPSPEFGLPNQDGEEIRPFRDGESRITVFLFLRADCPISNRYAPEIQRLMRKFGSRGVRFWLVYPGMDESNETIRTHLRQYQYDGEALRDPDHKLVAMTGVEMTPEVAVFTTQEETERPGSRSSSRQRLQYRGRIDDRFVDFGRTRPAPTTHDLEDALNAILEGSTIENPITPAIGCFIPSLSSLH